MLLEIDSDLGHCDFKYVHDANGEGAVIQLLR
jgi:hypothetical protein